MASECWMVKKKQYIKKKGYGKKENATMKLWNIIRNKIRNECIHKKLEVDPIEDTMTGSQLKWFGCMQRRPLWAQVKRSDRIVVHGSTRPRSTPKQTNIDQSN